MRARKVFKIQAAVMALGVAWLLLFGGNVIAQYARTSQDVDGRIDRLEREAMDARAQVQAERASAQQAAIAVERRLTRLETQIGTVINLLVLVAGALLVQFVGSIWGAIARVKPRRRTGDTAE